jgi:predicted DNA-binding protein (MmcQ/YjbR family)
MLPGENFCNQSSSPKAWTASRGLPQFHNFGAGVNFGNFRRGALRDGSPMNIDWIRDLCLSFPHTSEHIQWGDDLVFKVAGKIHAITVLKPSKIWLSFKASPEKFAELTERPGIIPAPYLARAKWIALETKDALPPDELALLLRESYDMVVAKLPRKTRETLTTRKPAERLHSPKKTAAQQNSQKARCKKKRPSR